AEALAPAGHAAADGADRPAELPGRVVVAESLEVAQQQRRPLRRRQALELFFQHVLQLAPGGIDEKRFVGRLMQPLDLALAQAAGTDAPRDAGSDAVEPARDGFLLADGRGLTRQQQKRGLEGVLGVLSLTEDALADAQHHRAVPLQERSEGALLAE